MGMAAPTDDPLREADEQIEWVLDHPGMSAWLKETLRAARDKDPVNLMNDLEMLGLLLRARSQAAIDLALINHRRTSDPPPRRMTE
jgi:hypothetical protein